jgi:hypothetical protein
MTSATNPRVTKKIEKKARKEKGKKGLPRRAVPGPR